MADQRRTYEPRDKKDQYRGKTWETRQDRPQRSSYRKEEDRPYRPCNKEGGFEEKRGGYRRDDRREDFRKDTFRRDDRREDFRKNDFRKDNYRKDDYRAPEAPMEQEQIHQDEAPYFLMGRNAVREALKTGRSVDRILVVREMDGSLREIVGLAKDRNVLIREVDRKKLDDMCMPFGHGGKPGNHQGIIALVPEIEYVSIQEILDEAKVKNEAPFVIVLQEIMDPHNLGSILRSAACAGAHGVVIVKRRAASVTAAVAKASQGAVEYIKVARVANLNAALEELKKAGVWVAGADMQGKPMDQVDMSGPLALVIGSEGEGLSRLVKENCDHLVRIPIQGPIDSLNASVAAAVLMFEKRRQDGAAARK